ncbi:50S ribosomal protein L9 [Rhodoligotrophos defluvii]|uniref:50S ribosomal protein L9 n=1 Tax=Rhodoligotrophos defluvii TaxID=2561934 RepID=UPI0010C94FBD|nr:50S ribosomal protein L9 [Rhodoligotrophos defluvii]
MHVILLERVEKLGAMGDVVKVRDGYARNYLLPKGKALRASEENKKRFEAQRETLEQRNAERKSKAEQQAASIDGKTFVVIRQAGESGQLYGSVSTRDIAEVITAETGTEVVRNQVVLDHPIKTIGMTQVRIALHPEVPVTVTLNVARSADEADAQARGENLAIPVDERLAAMEAAGFDEIEAATEEMEAAATPERE